MRPPTSNVSIKTFTGGLLVACLASVGCHAQPASAAEPAAADSDQADVIPADATGPATDVGSQSADAWLKLLESRAARINTLESVVRMTSRVELLDEETVRFGRLQYAADIADRPVRFSVRFDKLRVDEVIEPIDQAFIFDGRWLLDLDAADRQATRRELVASDSDAAQVVEGGPFPLPLNLQRDRVRQRFEVVVAPAAEDDPAPLAPAPDASSSPPPAPDADAQADPDPATDRPAVVHLVLTPRAGTDFDGQQLDLWFDTATALPLRSITLQNDGDTNRVDFFRLQPNVELDEDIFDTAFPAGDWERQTVPLD